MPDPRCSWMGIALSCPVVVAACPVSSHLDRIKEAEQHGAGGIVVRSLFEEQVRLEEERREYEPQEAQTGRLSRRYVPQIGDRNAYREHLRWLERTKNEVRMPVIGSINAVQPGNWTRYARDVAATGVDALELNIYTVPADILLTSSQVEQRLLDIVSEVSAQVTVPVALKLAPWYTAVGHLCAEAARCGARGLTLFNRFIQPDIDTVHQTVDHAWMPPSTALELRLPVRWTALLSGRIKAEIAITSGVRDGEDVAKALLAGAACVQVAGLLLEQGISALTPLRERFVEWMRAHDHQRIEDFRGRLCDLNIRDIFAYERAQYIRLMAASE